MNNVWTPAESKFVVEHVNSMTYRDMALLLERSPGAVASHARKVLGLRKRMLAAKKKTKLELVKKSARAHEISYNPTPCASRELGWTK